MRLTLRPPRRSHRLPSLEISWPARSSPRLVSGSAATAAAPTATAPTTGSRHSPPPPPLPSPPPPLPRRRGEGRGWPGLELGEPTAATAGGTAAPEHAWSARTWSSWAAARQASVFTAITAARRGASVLLLESGSKPLRKVRVSGGGRCNVMHDAARWAPRQAKRLLKGDEQTAVFTRIFGYPSGICPPLHHGCRSSTSQ